MRALVLTIFVCKLIEILCELVDGTLKDIVVSLAGVGLGTCTFLLAPLIMTLVTELTYPIVTAIPNLLMFSVAAVLAVMISQQALWIEVAPLLIGVILALRVDEDDGWDTFRKQTNSPLLRDSRVDTEDA